jgi:putative PIG3 family NAD(P)H quinone oxidoreductase
MRAVVISQYGGPEVLEVREVPDPVPAPEEVRVRVVSASLNRADLLQRAGLYPDPRRRRSDTHPEIPGLEFAGVVDSVGERVTRWTPGDAVMGIDAGGGQAELICVHERQVAPVPSTVSVRDAGAIPEVFLTAWDALVVQGGLTSGRWALVHAGASGVGTAAIQIVRAMGARVAVTCSAGKMQACRELGAHLVLQRSPHDWAGDAHREVPGGFDVILDVIGADEVNRNLGVVAPQGTLVQVGLMGGGTTPVEVGLLLAKRCRWIGTTLRARPVEQKIALTQRFVAEVNPLFEQGLVRPIIDSRYALDDIVAAHRHMAANANVGKIVLDVASPA